MPTKLNQIIAVEKGIKTSTYQDLTKAHHVLQKADVLTGLSRVYTPKDEEGDKLPSEYKKVQIKADEVIKQTSEILTKLFDVTAVKDWANCHAKANVVAEGKTILADVPATYLLFLEKQLTDLHTFIAKLPILDPGENWKHDEAQACWASEPSETTRSKKVMRNHVKAEATDKHPAQVETYNEDVQIGTWRTIKYSGALPAEMVNTYLRRIEALQQAVKFAREEANNTEISEQKVGKAIFDYLFS